MLFEQKINQADLSPNEKLVANYILEHKSEIEHLTTRMIAKETYTTASTVIRLSHKLGYQGFNELKQDFYNEQHYLNNHFRDIDPNIPFDDKFSLMNIAKISQALMKETSEDTLSLINHDTLMQATQLLARARSIYICGIENNQPLIELFKYKMTRINRPIIFETHFGNQMYTALQATNQDCALIVSYSGQTENMVRIAKELNKNHVPVITLSSIGDNRLKNYASCVLHMSTREKLHSKIANFSTEYSIMLILNILYSTVFSLEYETNLNIRINRAKEFELSRYSTTNIIQEDTKREKRGCNE